MLKFFSAINGINRQVFFLVQTLYLKERFSEVGIVQCRDGGLDFFMLKSVSIRECLRGISWVVLASSAKRILMDNFGLLGFWTLLERDIEVFMTKITLSLRVIVILSSPQNRKKNRTLRESCLFLEKCGRYTMRKRSWWRAILLQTFFWEVFFSKYS